MSVKVLQENNRADELIRQQIELHGPMTFAEFTEIALYHPKFGYYHRAAPQRGRAGDYYTSLQVSRLFPEIFADAILAMKETLGTDQFSLVEVGSGSGEFLHGVLTELTKRNQLRGFQVWSVEKSQSAREALRPMLTRFPKTRVISSMDEIDWMGSLEGCVFSNEFFDALPFHRVLWEQGELRELFVRESGGRLREEPGDPSTPGLADYLKERSVSLAEGQKAEICLSLDGVAAELDRVLSRGFLLTVDYGEPSADLYRETRTGGTLQVYRRHERREGPFEDIGECDLTALVDFGRLAALGERLAIRPLIFASQGSFLLNSGEAVLRGMIEGPDEASRIAAASQAQQLIHPNAMGSRFHVLVQGKNVGTPELSGGRLNRIHRLIGAR